MATDKRIRGRIQKLKKEFDILRAGKDSLLIAIDEAEIPEGVYNSNAIENSTLTLKETEKILLEMDVARNVSIRELFEAKNLARVMEYIRENARSSDLDIKKMLFLHSMLLSGIDDDIAGRFRAKGEYVRVGTHVASAPEQVEGMVGAALVEYTSNHSLYFVDALARFHLDFEATHPFNDGNGRIGRVLMNWQLTRLGFPGVIIRDKEKKSYYRAFVDHNDSDDSRGMEKIVALGLMESLHKRITYLGGEKIIRLAEYAKKVGKQSTAIFNAARRQTIPAFREKGVWKIGGSD